jgi:hypothetical protein
MTNFSPPALLSNYQVERIRSEQSGLSKDDSAECTSYMLSCKCGNNKFDIDGYDSEVGILNPPIYTICSSCQSKVLLFDPKKHGYDAHATLEANYIVPTENQKHWKCSACNMSGLVLVSFEYAIEEEFFEEFTSTPPEEWFTWIYIFHKCAINEAYHLAFDYECA